LNFRHDPIGGEPPDINFSQKIKVNKVNGDIEGGDMKMDLSLDDSKVELKNLKEEGDG